MHDITRKLRCLLTFSKCFQYFRCHGQGNDMKNPPSRLKMNCAFLAFPFLCLSLSLASFSIPFSVLSTSLSFYLSLRLSSFLYLHLTCFHSLCCLSTHAQRSKMWDFKYPQSFQVSYPMWSKCINNSTGKRIGEKNVYRKLDDIKFCPVVQIYFQTKEKRLKSFMRTHIYFMHIIFLWFN